MPEHNGNDRKRQDNSDIDKSKRNPLSDIPEEGGAKPPEGPFSSQDTKLAMEEQFYKAVEARLPQELKVKSKQELVALVESKQQGIEVNIRFENSITQILIEKGEQVELPLKFNADVTYIDEDHYGDATEHFREMYRSNGAMAAAQFYIDLPDEA